MIVRAIVKPSSKEDKVEKLGEGEYKVSVKAPAVRGRANISVKKLSKDKIIYFNV